MEATSNPPPASPAPPARTIPWEDTGAAGAIARFVETVKLLATAPGEAFDRMPTVGGIGQPLVFAIVVGWIGFAVYVFWWFLLGGLSLPFLDRSELGEAGLLFGFSTGFTLVLALLAPIFVVIGVFIQAAILHVMMILVGGANRGFEATVRVCSYAQAAQLAQIVPLCGGLLNLVWTLILGRPRDRLGRGQGRGSGCSPGGPVL